MFKTKPEPHTHMHAHTHASQTGTVVSTWITLWFQVCSSCLSYFNLTLLCVNSTVYFSVYNCKPFLFLLMCIIISYEGAEKDFIWIDYESFTNILVIFIIYSPPLLLFTSEKDLGDIGKIRKTENYHNLNVHKYQCACSTQYSLNSAVRQTALAPFPVIHHAFTS